jgi:hypothetical protein
VLDTFGVVHRPLRMDLGFDNSAAMLRMPASRSRMSGL